ncbi:MAG TPA: hypothetical protein DCR55_08470 [Lentisphaeria bacterium]|nr:hypothetical protein [Lentisphaeria bacterium]
MKIQCPHCEVVIETPLRTFGQKIRCANCQGVTLVPLLRVAPTVVIHKYVIKSKLRESPFGARFLARHLEHGYDLELTIFPDDIAKLPGFSNSFGAISKRVAALEHQNLMRSAGLGSDDEIFYCLCEHVDGENLRAHLDSCGPLAHVAAVNLCRSVAVVLQYVQEEIGECHGNVKPANIMVDTDGVAKLSGLATSIYSRRHGGDDVVGTPYYVSPETLLGQPLDLRSDIFSLGCTLYHCITGVPPYRGGSPRDVAHRRLTETPTPISELAPGVPEETLWVIERMMARSLADRYSDYRSLLADLV